MKTLTKRGQVAAPLHFLIKKFNKIAPRRAIIVKNLTEFVKKFNKTARVAAPTSQLLWSELPPHHPSGRSSSELQLLCSSLTQLLGMFRPARRPSPGHPSETT